MRAIELTSGRKPIKAQDIPYSRNTVICVLSNLLSLSSPRQVFSCPPLRSLSPINGPHLPVRLRSTTKNNDLHSNTVPTLFRCASLAAKLQFGLYPKALVSSSLPWQAAYTKGSPGVPIHSRDGAIAPSFWDPRRDGQAKESTCRAMKTLPNTARRRGLFLPPPQAGRLGRAPR